MRASAVIELFHAVVVCKVAQNLKNVLSGDLYYYQIKIWEQNVIIEVYVETVFDR